MTIGLNLEDMKSSKICQAQKKKYCVTSLNAKSKKVALAELRAEWWYQGLG